MSTPAGFVKLNVDQGMFLTKCDPASPTFRHHFCIFVVIFLQERRFFNLKNAHGSPHLIFDSWIIGVIFFLGEPSPSAFAGGRQVYVSEARAPLDMGGCNPGFHRFRLPAMKSLL